MMTPEEYDEKVKEQERTYNVELKAIAKKYNLVGDARNDMFDSPNKDDPSNLKQAKIECVECNTKFSHLDNEVKQTFRKTFYGIITERDKNKEEVDKLQKLQLLQQKSKSGDKKMEIKDEKEIEDIFSRLLNKHNKNSQFESVINDIHSKISKIDSIETKLADITPKISKIDSIETKLVDITPKISKIDSICEDGKCFKTELADIKKDLAETKKGKIKAEICTDCGEPAIVHSETFLASHCANCGVEVPAWTNDDGSPIMGWKNYKLRGK